MSQPLPTPRPFRKILTPPTPPQAISFPQVGHLLHLRQNIFQNSPIHHPPLNPLATTFMCIISLKLNHSQKNKKNSILNRRNYSSFLKLLFFCHQKKKKADKKADGVSIKFFLTTNTSLQRCLNPLSQIQLPFFLLTFLFWRISQPQVKNNQMVKENRIGRANVRKVGYACAMNKIGYILVFLEDETFFQRVKK